MRRFTLLLAASLWSILSFATEHFVQTSGLTFSPANITINQGDTVTWTIGGSHNVNGQQFLYPNNPASFFSGGVGAVSTYSFQFTIPGTYDYRCDPHVFAGMVGNIVVNPVMTGGQDISIVGIIDGPLPGGLPKAVEFYVHNDIADISGYSLANANNGGPFTTTPFDFPSMSVNAGDRFHIATDVANFTAFFGSAPDTISSVVNVNGDDVLGLFYQGTLVDVYGDLGVDGSGTPWEYLDGWAYRVDSMGPNPVFTLSEWTLSGINALDGSTSNSNANPAFPFETYNTGGGSSNPGTTPTYNIIDIRPTDATTGLGDSVGVYCKLVGTVYTIDFDGNAGISFWIQDQTAGINVFNFNDVSNYTVTPGDEIEVIGSIAEFNGLLEMVPDTINVISQGNPLPTPQVVTTPLDESLEGSYVRINNLTLTNAAQWPAAGNSANVDATDGTNTYLIRIDSDTDIDGSTAPSGLFDIVGAVGQFDNSSPFTSGHQVQPSSLMDIIVNTPASPTVNFAVSTQDELESAGTVNVQLTINPPAAAAGNLDIAFVPGAGITPSDVSTNPMVSIATGLLTIPFSAGDAMLSFQATINDDSDQEGNESVALSIANITGGVNVGPLNSMTFTILDNDIPIPTYDIADVKGVDANGVLDSTGVYCKIEGIVLGFNIQNPSGTNAQFTIQDATGGMGTFYSLNDIPYNPIEGDLIRMVGSLSQFNGLAQMNPDSITVLSSSNPLPNPQVVTVLDESTESQLIQINNVSLVDPNQWPAPGSNANVDITDGTNTFTMRIDSDTDVDDNVAAPMTPFDLVGIGGQFDNSSPFTDGYQILPRYAPDVMLPAPPSLSITEIMPGSNIPNAIISGDWWELENTGTTPIDINGFSWDDNSFNSGTVTFSSTTLQAGEVIIIWEGLSTDEGDFKVEWQIPASSLNIISSDEMTGNFPGLSQAGDGVAIYADNGAEICRAEYPTASAGVAVEFDSSCLFLGDATVGVNNAWNSISGDVGSPGNLAPFSVFDGVLEGSNIFPNPTSGLVNIELSNPMPASYTIFNSLGMRILSDELLNGRTQIDISALPAGIYMIELSQDQARSTARIIKR